MKKALVVVLTVLALMGCSPGLSGKDPVPNPNPDHGAQAPAPVVYLRWILLDATNTPAPRNLTFAVVYLSSAGIPLITVDPENNKPIPLKSTKNPLGYFEIGFRNPAAYFAEVTIIGLLQPGDFMECEVTLDEAGNQGYLGVTGPMAMDVDPDTPGLIANRHITMQIMRPPGR